MNWGFKGYFFLERVQKIKEKGKNKKTKTTKTKIENVQNGQEKYGGKLVLMHIWGKTSKILRATVRKNRPKS